MLKQAESKDENISMWATDNLLRGEPNKEIIEQLENIAGDTNHHSQNPVGFVMGVKGFLVSENILNVNNNR